MLGWRLILERRAVRHSQQSDLPRRDRSQGTGLSWSARGHHSAGTLGRRARRPGTNAAPELDDGSCAVEESLARTDHGRERPYLSIGSYDQSGAALSLL